MAEETLDQRAAKALGVHPEQVAIWRDEWESSPKSNVIKTLLQLKLQDQIAERERKLRKCSAEDLKTLQGELSGLDLATVILTSKL